MRANSGMSPSSVEAIINSLKLRRPDGSSLAVTVQQYFALLDTHSRTAIVENTLKSLFKIDTRPEELGIRVKSSPLDVIRIGGRKHLLANPFSSCDFATSLAFSCGIFSLSSFHANQLRSCERHGKRRHE